MNPVVHFEMPYENSERVSNFYSKVFGWQMVPTGPEMGYYLLAGTTETDENRMVKTPGTINGGFFKKAPEFPAIPSVVINVDDINAAVKMVNESGGKVVRDIMEIPGIGHYAAFLDTEGNSVGVMQPLAR